MRIRGLGDSITYGSEGGYRPFLRRHLETVGQNVEFVGAQKDATGGHEGYPGFTIEDVTVAHDGGEWGTSRDIEVTLADYRPDVMLFMVGTNNLYLQDPWECFGKLVVLIERVANAKPGPKIVVSSILPVVPGPKPWDMIVPGDVVTHIPEFNGCLRGWVQAQRVADRAFAFVDNYRALAPFDELEPDGVHPRSPVYERMGRLWFEALGFVRL